MARDRNFRPALTCHWVRDLGLNSDGRAEWFATGAGGTLRHSCQEAGQTATWSGTRDVGDSPGPLAGDPAAALGPSGSFPSS